jgi:beta-phosphoglucomutase-like phosphatase (HAD superfamily)
MSEQAALLPQVCAQRRKLAGAILDVDGVLVASPHEQAWREALAGYADPARFTTEFYQTHVAGKPLLDGGRATLEGLGVAEAGARAPEYARKNQALVDLLAAKALKVPPAQCVVVEDAPAGIAAARAGGMASVRIGRLGDEAMLQAAGTDLVVTSLDQVDTAAVPDGILRTRPVMETSAYA